MVPFRPKVVRGPVRVKQDSASPPVVARTAPKTLTALAAIRKLK